MTPHHLYVGGPCHGQFRDDAAHATGVVFLADPETGSLHTYHPVEVAITNSLRERQSWIAYAHYEILPSDRLAAVLHCALTQQRAEVRP